MPNAPGPGEARTLQPWTRMDRPLWQFFLALLAAGFVVQRGGAAAVLYLSNAPPLLLAGFAIQIAAGLATAAGLWLGRRWVIGALAALGISAVATAVLAASLGAYPIGIAIGHSLVAAVATGG